MNHPDLTDLALRNLRESILRNTLTTLGVAVGVASLVAMVSLGVGLQELASKRLSQSGLFDTILVTTKNTFRGMGPPQREADSGKPRAPDEDARHELEKLPNVIEVYPQVRFYTEVRFNDKPYGTVVAGMPDSSRSSGSFDGMHGTFFSSSTADEAILQIEFARELSPRPRSAGRPGSHSSLCRTPGRYPHPAAHICECCGCGRWLFGGPQRASPENRRHRRN